MVSFASEAAVALPSTPLTLLRGAENAAELDLLRRRLEEGTLVFEETGPLPAAVRAAR